MRISRNRMRLSDFAGLIVGQSMFRILAAAQELEREGKNIIHFEIGDTYLEMPTEVKKSAVKAMMSGRTHYGPSHGEYGLRKTLCQVFKEDYGFLPGIEQTVITSGANPLIYYAMAVLVNPGEEVIVTDPAFVTYNAVLKMLKIKNIGVPVTHKNNFRFDPEKIEKRITKKTRLIVINSPCNPTGGVVSEKDIRAIYALAKKYNLYILSDEIYAPFVYEGKHFSAGKLDKCRERVIVTGGFSKPFAMTGWRVGYAVGPKDITDKIGLLSQTIVSCVPPFLQDACIIALENRKLFTKKYFTVYKQLRRVVCSELEKIPQLSFTWPQGSFYLFIDVSKTGMDGDKFSKYLLEKEGVVVCPGSGFGEGGKNYIRICYAKKQDKLLQGCKKIARAIQALHQK